MVELIIEGKPVRVVEFYATAKKTVVARGYAHEIEWQDTQRVETLSESQFLREVGWVILSSGMKSTTIERLFRSFSAAFLNWSSARAILRQRSECRSRAYDVFRHKGKIDAIVSLVETVDTLGFGAVRDTLIADPLPFLMRHSFLGPATSLHLAKNVGISVSKPDRHLVRIAAAFGCIDSHEICETLSNLTGDKVSVVDVVLWRYATLVEDYLRQVERSTCNP